MRHGSLVCLASLCALLHDAPDYTIAVDCANKTHDGDTIIERKCVPQLGDRLELRRVDKCLGECCPAGRGNDACVDRKRYLGEILARWCLIPRRHRGRHKVVEAANVTRVVVTVRHAEVLVEGCRADFFAGWEALEGGTMAR
ncbi:hypothetical protein B0H67DRAFT_582348 [Lasiosphaeris hirsuta]|uniref:Secreted protein n=1 Tax=Lasiosphaeris hirsuta TaxID=260670 RepID=A0AA40AHS5_9PEZI|nr:hypothetical protein B0H67DRAFT_582348 [Lasiosphaeris hirsuta]